MPDKPRPTIASLAARARECSVPIAELCRRSGVDYATFKRWVAGTTSPTLRKIEAFEAAVVADEENQ